MKRKAFSLVELSIVLVIIGLLVGGILAGQSLIRASEIRSVTTDYQRYMVAVRAFRDKYFAIPGDMVNATAFWGSLGGTGSDANCQIIIATGGTATCNGTNDGSLIDVQGTSASSSYEVVRFWQHLANAGLIEGQFNTGGSPTTPVPGTDTPVSKISGAYFWPVTGMGYMTVGGTTIYSGSPNAFAGDYGKNMFIFKNNGNQTKKNAMPLNPEEAWNIDTKIDDGMPGKGTILAFKGTSASQTNCTTTPGVMPSGEAGSEYALSVPNKDCFLYFPRAF